MDIRRLFRNLLPPNGESGQADATLAAPTPIRRKRRAQAHEFVVIGLGRFGTSVAETLVEHGHDVLAIDLDVDRVQHLAAQLPHIVQLDATNAEALHQLGLGQFQTGLVCIGHDFESNILATTLLLRFGVPRVISKARTQTQKTILEAIGAHEVILPEHQAGIHLGRRLAASHVVDYLEMKKGLGIVELTAPEAFWGHTLIECDLRRRHGLTVIAVHRGDDIVVNPEADYRIERDDILVVIGKLDEAEKLQD